MKLNRSESFILESLKATFKFEGLKNHPKLGTVERCTIRAIDNPSHIFASAVAGTERDAFELAIKEAQIKGGVPAGPQSKDAALSAEVASLRETVNLLLAQLQAPASTGPSTPPVAVPPAPAADVAPPAPEAPQAPAAPQAPTANGDIPPVVPPAPLSIRGRGKAGADPNKA